MHDDNDIHMKRLIEYKPDLYGLDAVLNAIDKGRIHCGRYARMVKRVKVDIDKKKVVIRDGDTSERRKQQKNRRHDTTGT